MTTSRHSVLAGSTSRLRRVAPVARALSVVAITVSLAGAWALCAAHLALGDGTRELAVFHASTGWWAAGAVLPLIGAALLGRPLLAVAAVVPALLGLGWVLPGTVGGPLGHESHLRVVSSNVLMVNPDPAGLVAELFAHDPDVVVLQEYSPRFHDEVEPFLEDYPYSFERAAEHSFGYAVFSRVPIERVLEVEIRGVTVLETDVEVHGRVVRIANVHALPPLHNAELWHAELAGLADRYANFPGPLVLAGDLNATRHHPSFQALIERAGLTDGHAAVGRAAALTWPQGSFVPPLVRLDHMLVKGVQAVDVREGRAIGTDHSPIIADLRMPDAP